MSHLTGTEIKEFIEKVYSVFLGEDLLHRWINLKLKTKIAVENDFIEYLLESGEHRHVDIDVTNTEPINLRCNSVLVIDMEDDSNSSLLPTNKCDLSIIPLQTTASCEGSYPSAIEHVDLSDTNNVSEYVTPNSNGETVIAEAPLFNERSCDNLRDAVLSSVYNPETSRDSSIDHNTLFSHSSPSVTQSLKSAELLKSNSIVEREEKKTPKSTTSNIRPIPSLESGASSSNTFNLLPAITLSYTSNDPSWCNLCGKNMYSKSYLKTHFNTVHLGQKPYKCDYCPQKFTRISTLSDHVRAVHMRMKPHACVYCKQGFAKASNLRAHISSVHLNKRNYDCSICARTFSSNGKRLIHEKRHRPLE